MDNDSSSGLLNNENESDDESLDIDKDINHSSIADLLEDFSASNPTVNDKYVVEEVSDKEEKQEYKEANIIGIPNQINRDEREIPEITFEEEGIPMRRL